MTPSDTGNASSASEKLPNVFATTHWSVVLTAARSDSTRAGAALEHLCRSYWYPIYHFVRRQGHSTHDAQDFTQAFFARLLGKTGSLRRTSRAGVSAVHFDNYI
jgi:RNA polymerase sigma-70 factor (ECF subfamily)